MLCPQLASAKYIDTGIKFIIIIIIIITNWRSLIVSNKGGGGNFYSFLISTSLSAIPFILHEWLLMITLINNSEKVVPDLHASMNASMNLNHFNMSFYCDDFFNKEILIS